MMKIPILLTISLFSTTLGGTALPRLPPKLLQMSANISAIMKLNGGKIIDGQEAKQSEFPYQVSVQWMDPVTESWSHACGGSIYDTQTVITVAHCVDSIKTAKIRVVAGELSLSTVSGKEQISTSTFKIHPNYTSYNFQHDIALLYLTTPLNFNKDVGPLNIQKQNEATADGTKVVVAGWGVTDFDNDNNVDVLLKTTLPVVSQEACRNAYPDFITDGMICTGYENGGTDSCHGDSGGALVAKGSDGKSVMVGSVSWGYRCGEPKFYGVNTRISYYADWVKTNAIGTSGSSSILYQGGFSTLLLLLLIIGLALSSLI